MSSSKSTTFIGQAPSSETEGKPTFSGRAGILLASLLDISQEEMLQRYRFINLLDHFPGHHHSGKGDRFDFSEGTEKARALLQTLDGRVVLLGKNVLRCFLHGTGLKKDFYDVWIPNESSKLIFSVIPHPSGISRHYNLKENQLRCSKHLKRFLNDTWEEILTVR